MIPILAISLAAWAGEHDLAAPAAVGPRGVAIPTGPPVVLRVEPDRALQAVVDELPAGSTLVLAPGTWHGSLILDRPMTLRGEAGATLDGGGVGTVLTVAADDVTASGLRIRGGGDLRYQDDAGVVVSGRRFRLSELDVESTYLGIDLRRAYDGVVERCKLRGTESAAFGMRGDGIRLWESDGNRIEGNELESVRDLVVWYSERNTVVGNHVRHSRYGTHLMHAENTRVEGNHYDEDVVGVFVMYSAGVELVGNTVNGARGEAGVGIGIKESDDFLARGNVLVDATTGVYLDTTPHSEASSARFEENLVGACHVGVRLHGPSRGALFTRNTFLSNGIAATVDGRTDLSGVHFDGNHWSGYAGYDLDRDGFGDLPHREFSAAGTLIERRPGLAYFSNTPAAALLELFARAFPMFAPQPVVHDDRPWAGR